MKADKNEYHQTYTAQPSDLSLPLDQTIQKNLALGGVALGTMVCMTVLIREIRLLVQASRP